MDVLSLSWGTSLLAAFFGFTIDQAELRTDSDIWHCDPHVWIVPIHYDNGYYKTTITARCWAIGQAQTGLKNYEEHLFQRILNESTEVRSQIQTVYGGLPGYRIDSTIAPDIGLELSIEQLTYIATDSTRELLFDTYSNKVHGSGKGAYLSKFDTGNRIRTTNIENRYQVDLLARFHFDKPWYVPSGYFKGVITEELDLQIPQAAKTTVLDAARNL